MTDSVEQSILTKDVKTRLLKQNKSCTYKQDNYIGDEEISKLYLIILNSVGLQKKETSIVVSLIAYSLWHFLFFFFQLWFEWKSFWTSPTLPCFSVLISAGQSRALSPITGFKAKLDHLGKTSMPFQYSTYPNSAHQTHMGTNKHTFSLPLFSQGILRYKQAGRIHILVRNENSMWERQVEKITDEWEKLSHF